MTGFAVSYAAVGSALALLTYYVGEVVEGRSRIPIPVYLLGAVMWPVFLIGCLRRPK